MTDIVMTTEKSHNSEDGHPTPPHTSLSVVSSIESSNGSSSILAIFAKVKDSWSSFFSFDNNNNAKAVAMAHIPRGAAFCSLSVYFSAALVQIATQAAGCEIYPQGQESTSICKKKIFGLKPSSMLSMYILILGISVSIFLPIVGAMLDSSKYKRFIGGLTSTVLSTITFVQSFVSKENWILMMILQIFSSILLEVEYCIVLSYIPELTNDDSKLTHYNVIFATIFNLTVLLFLVGMTITSVLLKDAEDTIIAARIAMTTTFVLQITFYSYSWVYLFGPNHVHHNQQRVDERGICHFLTSSLKHVRQTLCEIFQQRREIKWCLIARSLTQASNIGFIAALLSYLSDTLQISSRNLGIATLILLATAIPGNQISMPLSRRLNPLKSLQICLFVLACFGASLSYLVYEPGHETRLFLLTVILGIASGWREPTEKTLWCQLVPKSSSAEMMGLYLFFSQILVWLPPLIFTVLNESANIQIALSSFGVYFFVGSVLSFFMGDYEKALANTKSCDEKIEIEERLGVGIGEITPGLTSLSSKDSEEESNIITKIGEIEKRFDP